jgi:hypothetical protein
VRDQNGQATNARAKRPPMLLEWNRCFARHPVPIVIDGKLHYAWLQSVSESMALSAPYVLTFALNR